MARCPDCNKFVSKNVDEEPDVVSEPEVTDGVVSMSVRIFNQCEDCSTELEETTLELEGRLGDESTEWVNGETLEGHSGDGHELQTGDPELSRTDSGGGRFSKRMFGVDAVVDISCSCHEKKIASLTMHDEVASSSMESLV